MSEEDIIKAGISAVKSGDLTRAASLFAQIVKENPSSERGWFLLGMSCATLEQREYCLRRVLAINPNHSDARKQLAGLAKPASTASVPAWTARDSKPFVSPPKPPASQESRPFVNPPVSAVGTSPFVFDDTQDNAEKLIPTDYPVEKPVQKSDQSKKRKPQKKKINIVIVLVAMLSVLILIVSGLGVVYLLLSTRTTHLTLPSCACSCRIFHGPGDIHAGNCFHAYSYSCPSAGVAKSASYSGV